jgi:hypothetical protein
MNPSEQATHRTKTAQLGHRLDTLETVVDGIGLYTADVSKWAPVVTRRLELHSTTLEALTASNQTLQADVHQLQTQHRVCNAEDRLMALEYFKTCATFWQRLRWLVTGR